MGIATESVILILTWMRTFHVKRTLSGSMMTRIRIYHSLIFRNGMNVILRIHEYLAHLLSSSKE